MRTGDTSKLTVDLNDALQGFVELGDKSDEAGSDERPHYACQGRTKA